MSVFTDLAAQIYSGAAGRFDFVLALFNNTKYAKERLDAHTHDGVDSQLIPVGANELRNGSFGGGTVGWSTALNATTFQAYSTGSSFINSSALLNGAKCVAFTSVSTAVGGGEIISDEYIPVTGGSVHSVNLAILAAASTANLSAKVEIVWYAVSGGASISADTVYSTTNAPIALSIVGGSAVAPSAARYKRVRVTGLVAGSGTGTGTLYMGGVVSLSKNDRDSAGGIYVNQMASGAAASSLLTATGAAFIEVHNVKIVRSGIYRFTYETIAAGISFVGGNPTNEGRIYKNGVAYGVIKSFNNSGSNTLSDELEFTEGDTAQLFIRAPGGATVSVEKYRIGSVTGELMAIAIPLGIR